MIVLVRVKGEVLSVCAYVGLCLVNQENEKYDNNLAFFLFKAAKASEK